MYFNYHAKAKNLIKQGNLTDYKIVDSYHGIEPALLLIFNDYIMPIRFHKWQEYFDLIEKSKDTNPYF